MAAGAALLAPGRMAAQDQGVEELTRGPVHEAFATVISYDAQPGIIVTKTPPALIEEVPPEQRPAGDNVSWIPGYWGWDVDQNDFIWISGVWRNLPPGRQWVPGYWADLGAGRWQWTSGYWTGQESGEVAYLPPPPKSVEAGPNVAAPSDDDAWIPGTWIMRDDRYAWRPGYWEPGRANWIWIPAHYQWTCRGFIFIEGYWDYCMDRRGMLFAPVRFRPGFYGRPGYIYTPAFVISLNVFATHLFVRPRYGHYYFGDYYSPKYAGEGFYASYSYESGRHGYDPIFSYNRWEHRHESGWVNARKNDYAFYRDHSEARPPATWAAMQALPEGKRAGQRDHYTFAQPLKTYTVNRAGGQSFQSVGKETRDKIVSQNHEVQKFSQERLRVERGPVEKTATNTTRVTFAKSPVLGKPAEQFNGSDAPPKPHAIRNALVPGGSNPPARATEIEKHAVMPGNPSHAERQPVPSTPRPDLRPARPVGGEVQPVQPNPHAEHQPGQATLRPDLRPARPVSGEVQPAQPNPRAERQPGQAISHSDLHPAQQAPGGEHPSAQHATAPAQPRPTIPAQSHPATSNNEKKSPNEEKQRNNQ